MSLSFGIIIRFVLAAVIGAGGAFGVAAATAQPASSAVPGPDSSFRLTSDTGDQPAAIFGITAIPEQAPIKLAALPDDQRLQLVSFAEPGPAPASPPPGFRPAWLAANGFPRVVPITQFDGGPLQGSNCTMAAGAMLARLGYGIVTTGSQLRALQPDQEGGTSLSDLEVSIGRYGVTFSQAPISSLQLRALLYAGAGAVVQGTYGDVPLDLRLQKDFTGGHAIYLDGFRPASADGPAAYYVIDPLGPTWAGYRGGWWPADVVEAFAAAFGGGSIYAAWAFPGGKTPSTYPILPPAAYPSPTPIGPPPSLAPGVSPSPSAGSPSAGAPSPSAGSPSPSAGSPAPSASASAEAPSPSPPLLPSSNPSASIPPSGPTPPSLPPDWWDITILQVLSPHIDLTVLLGACTTAPIPTWCPGGIIGIFPPDATPPPTLPPLETSFSVDLLYANAISPGVMQVIFATPDGTTPALQFWDSSSPTAKLDLAPSVEPALLNGKLVEVAQFPIVQGGTYDFIASAAGTGVKALSPVGTIGG
jgi:hypothetical protein